MIEGGAVVTERRGECCCDRRVVVYREKEDVAVIGRHASWPV